MPIISCLATLRARAATRIFPRAAFSLPCLFLSRNIIRATAGASHTSVWRYARDIEISLHRKFECGIYPDGNTPRIVKPFPRDVESFHIRKAITVPQWLRRVAVSSRAVLRDIYLIFSWEKKDDFFKWLYFIATLLWYRNILKLGQPIVPCDRWRIKYVWLYIYIYICSSTFESWEILVTLFHFMLPDVLPL